ncbi:MAG: ATP-binding protein, partial [Candidatus Zixiibacteriota bacterium]
QSAQDLGLIVILDDVTEQKTNEQRLFDLARFAERGMMASSISHELNNFLGLILGGIEIAQLAIARGDTEKANASFEKLRTVTNNMKRFTAGLMDYGKLHYRTERASLNTVVSGVLSFVTVQNKFKLINIHTELATDLPDFQMDTDQMAQLLLNLLNNAADAVSEANRDPGEITVKTLRADNFVTLSVADNGVGIEAEIQGKLFKSHLTTKKDGHGYGLVTCAKIIENHQGEVEVHSEVGHGTTITVRFPTQVAGQQAPQE